MQKIFTTTSFLSFFLFGSLSFFSITLAYGQSPGNTNPPPQKPSIKEALPARLGENWKATNDARLMNAEQFSVLPVGEIFAEYGLQTISTREYDYGSTRYTVEIFQMAFKSGAYGLFTFNRDSLADNRKEFFHGRFLISISSEHPIGNLDPSLIESIKQTLQTLPHAESGEMPSLPLHLPDQNRIPSSEKYLVGPLALAQIKGFGELKEVVPFTGGAEAVSAIYSNGAGTMPLLLIEYHTPQLATDGYASLKTYFDSLSQAEREKRILTRTGNYIIMATNIEDHAAAQNLVSQIKYTPRIYWEGRKSSDIPLEFRPPDPAAVEEALQTTHVILRTFYWIGVMLTSAIILGIFAGGTFFYWKRYRRRKLGLDNLFTDAGGAIRLDLEEYLLPSPENKVKRIGSESEEN